MPFLFGFDPTFMLLIPALIFAVWAQFKVKNTYQRYAQVRSAHGKTGAEIAQAIMARNGVSDVQVEEVGGTLSDHYDPRTKVVSLSSPIFRDASIASTAVAAHEVGHVLQHHDGYAPLAIRSLVAPVAQIGSFAAFPLFFIGIFFFNGHGMGAWLVEIGIWFFTGAVLFQLVTLPVEFDASRRALAQLTASGTVMPEEVDGARKVLNAAALTYVAAAAMAALQLLRMLLIRDSRR
ncbi:MAG: zinc metallopeptidase [Candidatus Eisenbacteria bacterium]|uniref:Zinc metallopeptidase n=1 Tax=Eiseniibacteriota bacterium TaxID=2212470 RepID=A0A9D6L7U2_UNCEI|nr:zinc metallopeptidase [Candidatus Eisenbacteria bacterium]MBI3540326.1 zinc metallopeptidase [Candidatus Eisenbacteria bacterium]